MPDDIRSTISSGNLLLVFSVYIPFLISRIRPVHSIFEKKSIIENTSQIKILRNLGQLITKRKLKKETTLKKDGLFKVMIKFIIR